MICLLLIGGMILLLLNFLFFYIAVQYVCIAVWFLCIVNAGGGSVNGMNGAVCVFAVPLCCENNLFV